MNNRTFAAALAGTTALVLPLLAGPSLAQQQANPCETLLRMVTEAGDSLREEFRDVPRMAEANDPQTCTIVIAEVEKLGGLVDPERAASDDAASEDPAATETASETETETRDFSASDTVTSTVEVEQKAIVEGEVIVGLPDPEIAVEQPGAEVSVREGAASLTIDERPANIVVRQRQASITLDMPQPTITIEQPAPEIVITMPRAGVSLDRSAPRVDVIMADPRVTVSQADPTLDVEVDARFVDPESEEARRAPEEGVVARTQRVSADGSGESDADAAIRISKGEARVSVMDAEEQAAISYNRAEPNVTWEAAEPDVTVTSRGEPRVEIRQTGEARVTFRQQEGDEASARPEDGREMARRAALSPDERARILGRADTSGMSLSPAPVRVRDLVGLDVLTADGDEVGEISRIVTNNSLVFAVVEHGGFLGLGEDEVALPLRRFAIHGDDALLLGLSEEELDADAKLRSRAEPHDDGRGSARDPHRRRLNPSAQRKKTKAARFAARLFSFGAGLGASSGRSVGTLRTGQSSSADRAQRLMFSSSAHLSIASSSRLVNSRLPTAPTQSSTWEGFDAPISAVVMPLVAQHPGDRHLRQRLAAPLGDGVELRAGSRSRRSLRNSGRSDLPWVARLPSGMPSRYFAVSIPCASGVKAMEPMPSSASVSFSPSRSTQRLSML